MHWRDIWAVFWLMLTGPITAVMFVLFGLGYLVYYKLHRFPTIQLTWRYVYGIPFSLLNFLYNITIGSVMWLERPRWLQFTRRLKDQKKQGRRVAFFLCECVNFFDPGHC